MINGQQRRFAAEYVKDRDPIAAALRAGVSTKMTAVTAARMLARPDVQAIIAMKSAADHAVGLVSKAEVMAELIKMAFADPKEVKPSDKNVALRLIGNALGMWKPTTFDGEPATDGRTAERKSRGPGKKTLAARAEAEIELSNPPIPAEAPAVSPLAALIRGIKH